MNLLGKEAPSFETTSSSGEPVRLADYKGQRAVVLFFYPKDFTWVCTREACGFRDAYSELAPLAEVIGVSRDGAESHLRFAKEHKLPFPLVSDPDGELAEKFGVKKRLLGLGGPGRVTFVIDRKGIVREIIESELSAEAHVDGVKRALAKL